ncbi:5-oxoprolinase subunit PxpB [Chitinibacter sp. SCUT-21]|uniref:5-oxoprolinase subunit PxpB n=1 Tax=Chitinibacter sp. SCUT-21 TaxID=2970891 RepID=UPI0035A6CCFA
MSSLMIYPLGETALVLQTNLAEQSRLIAMLRHFEKQHSAHTGYQMVLGVGNLTLRFNPLQQSAEDALLWLQQQWALSEMQVDEINGDTVEIPVVYGGNAGPDLEFVAEQASMSVQQVIEAHCTPLYQVLCIGFLPGFPYLAGLAPVLHTPRRAEPRSQVPAGSVGIGGAQTGIYPCSSPGGWHLIGRTALTLFDANANPPCRLQAGDRVRFVAQDSL